MYDGQLGNEQTPRTTWSCLKTKLPDLGRKRSKILYPPDSPKDAGEEQPHVIQDDDPADISVGRKDPDPVDTSVGRKNQELEDQGACEEPKDHAKKKMRFLPLSSSTTLQPEHNAKQD